jgi:hypothetical protein
MVRRPLRRRFWVETSTAALSTALLLLTLLRRDWIEGIVRVEPDRGDGTLEWLVVATFVVLNMACSLMARREWRRAAVAAG